MFSPGKNNLHELFLEKKIFLSFSSSPPPPLPNIPSKSGELDKYSGLFEEILVSENCWLRLHHVFAQCPCTFSDLSSTLSYLFTFHLSSLTKH